MESSIWWKISRFIKSCFTEYKKIFKWGSLGGSLSGISLFFISDSSALITFGSFLLKVVGTLILGLASGAGAVLGKKWIEGKGDHEKKSTDPSRLNAKRKRSA